MNTAPAQYAGVVWSAKAVGCNVDKQAHNHKCNLKAYSVPEANPEHGSGCFDCGLPLLLLAALATFILSSS